jgi:uncharacterized protein YabN with tetrapyrrole methylase and pyrophosphatase domain
MARGSLTVVGLGMQPAHVTVEARAVIRTADEVLYGAADPGTVRWIERLNPRSRSLHGHYTRGRPRFRTYAAMVDEVLARVREGGRVCFALYGHPGVFVTPSHRAVARARAEGFSARMLPAVSAEDCIFADLGIDPALHGCQSYDATDLLVYGRRIDPSASLIVWQIGVVGIHDWVPDGDFTHIPLLVEYLEGVYPAEHEVVVYEASAYPICDAFVERVTLSALPGITIPPMATLYVPPAEERGIDRAMLGRFAQAAPKGSSAPRA